MSISYHFPTDSAAAWALISDPKAKVIVIGGGTVTTPTLFQGASTHTDIADLSRAGLHTASDDDGRIRVGAMIRIVDFERITALRALRTAARSVGSPALRNLATIGGNVAYRGDLAVAMLALKSDVDIRDRSGQRTVSLEDFYRGDVSVPYLITGLTIPKPLPLRLGYYKFARRAHNTSAIVTATVVWRDDAVRIAIGGATPSPFLVELDATEVGQDPTPETCRDILERSGTPIEPITDAQASAWYRARVIPIALARAIGAAQAPR